MALLVRSKDEHLALQLGMLMQQAITLGVELEETKAKLADAEKRLADIAKVSDDALVASVANGQPAGV